MTDPLKQAAEEEAKILQDANDRRKAAGLEAFSELSEEAWDWINAEAAKADAGEPAATHPAAEKKQEEPKPERTPEAKAPETFVPPTFSAPKAAEAGDSEKVRELEREIQKLKSERGRWDAAQAEREQLLAQKQAAEQRAAEAERKALELEAKAGDENLLSSLSQEEIDELGGSKKAAGVILKIAKSVVNTRGSVKPDTSEIESIRRELEESKRMTAEQTQRDHQSRVQAMFRDVIAKEVPPELWAKFSGPSWEAWGAETYAGIPNRDLYRSALESLDSRSTADLMKRYLDYAGVSVPAKGKQPPLKADVQNSPDGAPSDKPAEKEYRYEEVCNILRMYYQERRLPTGWSQAKFNQEAENWEKAALEGRVKDASGNPRVDLP